VRVDPRFAELYEAEFQTIFRTVFLLCGDRAAAEDATQEGFARALERWRRLRDQPWVAGWITTTAINAVRRSLRRRPEPPPAERSDVDVEESWDLWRAVRALPRRQQEAVVLHYVLDMSVAETGRAMGCEDGTVKVHLARARESLRGRLEEALDE
jgi:RNA polymerase sigma-70 factor (ECF subfamily)